MMRVNLAQKQTQNLNRKWVGMPLPLLAALLLISFLVVSMIAGKAFASSTSEFTGKSSQVKYHGKKAEKLFLGLDDIHSSNPDSVDYYEHTPRVTTIALGDTTCTADTDLSDKENLKTIYYCTIENP